MQQQNAGFFKFFRDDEKSPWLSIIGERGRVGYVFGRITRPGAASERPYGKNSNAAEHNNRGAVDADLHFLIFFRECAVFWFGDENPRLHRAGREPRPLRIPPRECGGS
jgi:hypothetical protein